MYLVIFPVFDDKDQHYHLNKYKEEETQPEDKEKVLVDKTSNSGNLIRQKRRKEAIDHMLPPLH